MDHIRILERQCRALSQRRRLQILSLLKKRRCCTVGEIAREVHCTIHAVSQHLRVLRGAGIVLDRRRGIYVFYVLSPQVHEVVRAALRHL